MPATRFPEPETIGSKDQLLAQCPDKVAVLEHSGYAWEPRIGFYKFSPMGRLLRINFRQAQEKTPTWLMRKVRRDSLTP